MKKLKHFRRIKMRSKMNGVFSLGRITLLVIFMSCLTFGEQVIPLPELDKPESIKVDENQIYITQEVNIFVYDLKDFKLKKKFGKQGEGPQEFMGDVQSGSAPLEIDVQTDHIIVNSLNKLSYFTKEGKFVKELRPVDQSTGFKPLGKEFAGQNSIQEGNFRYRVVNIYDSKLNKVKEVFRVLHSFQRKPGEGFKVLEGRAFFETYQDKLFVAMEPETFKIRVFDTNGKSLYSITHQYKKQEVTENDKKRVETYFKTHPRFKNFYHILKPLKYPEFYPPIRLLNIDNDKVYVLTYKQDKNKTEAFIFDLKGNLLKRLFVPVRMQSEVEVCPHAIKKGKFFQLAEDLDKEAWSLYINEIE
jgi:hypothetical protein